MARMAARMGAAALLAAAHGGWLWGASGRWETDRALRAAESRNDLVETRAAVLGSCVSLCDANYEDTSWQLANAQRFVGRACGRLDLPGTCDDLLAQLGLEGVRAEIDRARRLAAALGPGPGVAAGIHTAAGSVQPIENR